MIKYALLTLDYLVLYNAVKKLFLYEDVQQ